MDYTVLIICIVSIYITGSRFARRDPAANVADNAALLFLRVNNKVATEHADTNASACRRLSYFKVDIAEYAKEAGHIFTFTVAYFH